MYAAAMLGAPHPFGVVEVTGTGFPAAFSAIARFTAVCGAYSVRQRGASGCVAGQARRIAGGGAAAAGTVAVSAPATVTATPTATAIPLILICTLPGLLIGMAC
jgi:hypothetical protein